MNGEQIIRLSVDTKNRFFSSGKNPLFNMFSEYTKNSKILETSSGFNVPKNMSFQQLPLSKTLSKTLSIFNNIDESNINFELNDNDNFIFGLFPNVASDSQKQNAVFKGKKFKGIIKHGIDNYMLVDVTLNNYKGKLQISDMNITSDIFKSPNSVSKLLPNNKIVEDVYTMTPDGLIKVQNHDYYNFVNRYISYNYSVNEGSSFANSELLTMSLNVSNQSSSANITTDTMNATGIQTFRGIENGSPNSSVISNGAYISGKNLNEILIENTADIVINNDNLYKINFDQSTNNVISVEEFTSAGIKNDYFEGEDLAKNMNLTKERVMDFVGTENSKLRHLLTSNEVVKYNNAIKELNNKGILSSKTANVLAERIITEQQIKALNSYGFDQYLKKEKNLEFTTGKEYVNEFNKYYESLESPTIQEIDIYNYVNNNLNKNVIAANILEGQLFDNYLDVAKQSANIAGKVRYISQAEFTPFGYMNTDLQRKAQAANKFDKLSLTTSEGEVFEPSEIARNVFANSIREFEYKKTNFEYVQGRAINDLVSKRGGAEHIQPAMYKSRAKVLYVDSPLAFQDSDLFTNSFSLQNISMYNNKKPMMISYSSLSKNVFGDATSEEIQNFLIELQNKNYNFESLSDSKIKSNFIKNLLGEDAYSKYMAYKQAGNSAITEYENAFEKISKIKSISQNRKEFISASSDAVGKINSWFDKYAIRSNGEATVNILNPLAVEAGQNINVSGSNYNIIENIRFGKEGIYLDLKHILLQSGGTKIMLDNVKATTQGLTDLIEVVSDGGSYFVEGMINEKMTKGSRGFTGTFFARSLRQMASNSLYADYTGNVTELEDKFNLFKKTLSETKFAFGPNGKQVSILELLNIDLQYQNGTIYFNDLNVQKALNSTIRNVNNNEISVREFINGVSLDARIKNAMNENLRNLYGRDLTVDESKVLGSYASDLLYSAYDKLLSQMTNKSSLANRIRIKKPEVYKSYIAGDKVGMALATEKYRDRSIDEYAYLFDADIYQMEETKKRAIEEGLKVGRLSGLTLSEIGFNDLVDVIRNKSSYELNDILKGYLMLTAEPGTDFERGTAKFNAFFNNTIDLSDDSLVYNKTGMNISIQDYLTNSPLGRLMKFNAQKGKLEEVSKGVIKGFDNKYISDLSKFFNSKSAFKDINILAGTSIFQNDFIINYNGLKELNLKKEVFDSLKTKVKSNAMNVDIEAFFKLESSRELIKSKADSEEIVKSLYTNYRNFLYEKIKNIEGLSDDEKNILNVLSKSADDFDAGYNYFKSFVSMFDARKFTSDAKHLIYRDNIRGAISDFNLNKSSLNSLINYYSNNNLIENRAVITSFYNNIDNIKGVNMEYNLLDLKEISRFNSIPYIIDSMSVDSVGKLVPNQTINKLEKIISTNMELKQLYKIQSFFKSGASSEEIIKANKTSKEAKELKEAFKNFLNRHKDINFDKDGLISSMKSLYGESLISDIDLSSLDNKTVYNLMMLSDSGNEEISAKLSKYIFDIKKSKTNTVLNSNFISLLKKADIDQNIISNAEFQIINSLYDKSNIDIRAFMQKLETLESNYKNSENEEIYNNIHRFKNEVINFIGENYRKEILPNFVSSQDFINTLNESNLSNGSDVEKLVLGLIGKYRKSSSDLRRKMIAANKSNSNFIEDEIQKKQRMLTSFLINRNSHLGETILTKGGIIYDATSTTMMNSAAVSPREGSAITNFIRTEMYDVLKNKQIVDGKVIEGEDYKDLRKALNLIYGDFLVDGELKEFDDLYMSTDKISRKQIKNTINEIKNKLDNYSHIVVGDREMFTLNGQIGMFKGDRQFAYGMLSRHPHQYKFSVTPTRYVLLNESDKALSFIGKYIGTGNTVNGTQSSLYTIGKKTALGAKGDFDGDIFQIMFLGDKDLDYMKYKNMDAKAFVKKYNKKLELYNLLINSTSDNLENVFGLDPNNTSLYGFKNKKYNRIKKLVKDLYFDENYNLTNQEVYDVIKKPYLSLVHENVRVLKMLADETEEHAVLPEVLGDISIKGNKISKRSLTEFLLTLPDEVRNRYLMGDYNRYDIETVIKNNVNLSDSTKAEFDILLDSTKTKNGKQFIIDSVNYLKDDSTALAWQMLFRHVNKYRDDIGLYKTPSVHTKLTNFRNALDAMKNKETYARALAYLQSLQKADKRVELFVDMDTLSAATSSHDIGTLIEKLAISSKKGSVSPDIKITQFLKGEELIKNNSLNFNYKKIANMVIEMQSALARANSKDNFISQDILDLNFDEWFRSLYKNSPALTDDVYNKLKRSFLILSDVSSIDSKMENKDLTIFEIFDGSKKSLYNAAFSTFLSDWTTIMFKGQLERVLKINGDVNGNVYKQIMNLKGDTNFTYQFKKLWNIITNPAKNFGTRDESIVIGMTVNDIIKEKFVEAATEGADNIDNVISNESQNAFQTSDVTNNVINEVSPSLNKIESTVEYAIEESSKVTKKRVTKKEKEFKEMEASGNAVKLNFEPESQTVSEAVNEAEEAINEVTEKTVRDTVDNVINQTGINNAEKYIAQSSISDTDNTDVSGTPVNRNIKNVEEPSNQTVKEIINNTHDIDEVKEIINNTETQRLTDDINNQVDYLKQEIKRLEEDNLNKDKRIESLNYIIKTKNNENEELQNVIKENAAKARKDKSDATVIRKVKENGEKISTHIKETVKKHTNSDVVNKAKENMKKHKKALTVAGGVFVLSQFFRIFQKSRPVVNLDINEQEYERSQGSLYRNLGQYTMNTNIRSLY